MKQLLDEGRLDHHSCAVPHAGLEWISVRTTAGEVTLLEPVESAADLAVDRRESSVQLQGEIGARCLTDRVDPYDDTVRHGPLSSWVGTGAASESPCSRIARKGDSIVVGADARRIGLAPV